MSETKSLKSLSNLVIERNKKRNKSETSCQNFVSWDFHCETKNDHFLPPNFALSSDFKDAYEERIAIAYDDGEQSIAQAHRIAYQGAFISALNALPDDDMESKTVSGWLDRRITMAKKWIAVQGQQEPN
jgi:hypothetical protein